MIDAGIAGAAGFISMFNVSREEVESYFDPHEGTHYRLPGVYVEMEESRLLKQAAEQGQSASLGVEADVGPAEQGTITGSLQGATNETVYIVCHTDGNTWVQDNGISALINLARYFSTRPTAERQKSLAFVFTTGHLGYTADATYTLARRLDEQYDTDDTVMVIALEHMGTKEILPVGSPSGAANGQKLEMTGKGEVMVWCVGPSPILQYLSIADVIIGVQGFSKQEIAGEYREYREKRANGTRWALSPDPPVYAPGPVA